MSDCSLKRVGSLLDGVGRERRHHLPIDRLGLSDCHCLLHSRSTLQLLQLAEDIGTIVPGLTHAFVKVVKGRVGHLEGLS